MRLIAEGFKNKGWPIGLHAGNATARGYLTVIFRKLEVWDRQNDIEAQALPRPALSAK